MFFNFLIYYNLKNNHNIMKKKIYSENIMAQLVVSMGIRVDN